MLPWPLQTAETIPGAAAPETSTGRPSGATATTVCAT